MGLFLLIFVVISLVSLGLLMPSWTAPATAVYISLWVVFGGAVAFIIRPERTVWLLRLSAGVLGIIMTLNMIDFVTAQVRSGGSIMQARSPIAGFIFVGLPALAFAIWGGRSGIGKRLLNDSSDHHEHP
ncbi:MAG: hypothetical protein JJ916_08460 [Phycisphaerales bacterium]|nr:hypothetical protein [Phycisphaerales bacterium]